MSRPRHPPTRRSSSLCCSLPPVPCSPSVPSHTVRGAWAFQGQGTALMTVPGADAHARAVRLPRNHETSTGTGDTKARGRSRLAARCRTSSTSGTIQVNPDCTAIETGTVGPLQTAGRLIILDKGNEMRELPTTHPLGPVTELAYFRRISWGKPHCTNATVRGVYGGSGSGHIHGPCSRPASARSHAVLRHVHHVVRRRGQAGSGRATASLGGRLAEVEFSELTLTVNRDCTATLKYNGVVRRRLINRSPAPSSTSS